MEKNIDVLKIASKIGNKSKKIMSDIKNNNEIEKIRNRQIEHMYNIGKMIMEKNIVIEDKLINSNLNSIKNIMKE